MRLMGCRTGTAIGAVHGDEVRRGLDAAAVDLLTQLVDPAVGADDRLEARRLAGDPAHPVDHVEEIRLGIDLGMPVGD